MVGLQDTRCKNQEIRPSAAAKYILLIEQGCLASFACPPWRVPRLLLLFIVERWTLSEEGRSVEN